MSQLGTAATITTFAASGLMRTVRLRAASSSLRMRTIHRPSLRLRVLRTAALSQPGRWEAHLTGMVTVTVSTASALMWMASRRVMRSRLIRRRIIISKIHRLPRSRMAASWSHGRAVTRMTSTPMVTATATTVFTASASMPTAMRMAPSSRSTPIRATTSTTRRLPTSPTAASSLPGNPAVRMARATASTASASTPMAARTVMSSRPTATPRVSRQSRMLRPCWTAALSSRGSPAVRMVQAMVSLVSVMTRRATPSAMSSRSTPTLRAISMIRR